MKPKRFLFITSVNLASNPRLVKELKMAVERGYTCVVLHFLLGNLSDSASKTIEEELPQVRFIYLSATRTPLLPWLVSSLLQRLFCSIPPNLQPDWMLSIAVNKRALLLWWKLRDLRNERFDWLIAHNPPAFYPALAAAKQFGAKLGIDVEDYHPGETNDVLARQLVRSLMCRVLPQANYCSFAAPLIRREVQKDIPEMQNHQLVVMNGFLQNDFDEPRSSIDPVLRVVWFSQHITIGRGLENVIPVVNKLHSIVELHLIGALSTQFDQMHLGDKSGVVLHGTLSQRKLHQFLGEFDVGLATDLPVNRNREIALTNKILAYAQAGLVIAAMHTEAQDQFLQSSGLSFAQMENNKDSIEQVLLQLFHNKTNGKLNPIKQYKKARLFSWEEGSRPLLEAWELVG